jgi:hypothetical protein
MILLSLSNISNQIHVKQLYLYSKIEQQISIRKNNYSPLYTSFANSKPWENCDNVVVYLLQLS